MNKSSAIILSFLVTLITGCQAIQFGKSAGENFTTYSYIPLDPMKVDVDETSQNNSSKINSLTKRLPDQAVRVAIARFDSSGALSYGPASVGYEGNTYKVILDYISVNTVNRAVTVQEYIVDPKTAKLSKSSIFINDQDQYSLYKKRPSMLYEVTKAPEAFNASNNLSEDSIPRGPDRVNLPVYVGIGLRLTATVTVNKGSVDLSGLAGIGASAKAGQVSGTLVLQTLGINGPKVAALIPLPGKLNETTIENAILALGGIKAILYEKDAADLQPRVVGFYNPVGANEQFVNGVISVLSEEPIKFQ
jgi:hypothetical protein